jgi:hypothetical protein
MYEQSDVLLAYTKISPMTRVRIERILPAPGEILVRTGEQVEATQKIARIPVRGDIQVVNVARILGLNDRDLAGVMVKKRDDWVKADEIIAARQRGLHLLHKPCRSPISGRLIAIGHGWVVIESQTDPTEDSLVKGEMMDVMAFVTGQVTSIKDRRSVTIETGGSHILGACGVGDEANGVLHVVAKDPTQTLSPDDIEIGSNNAILVGGAGVSLEAIDRAREMQVNGIIVGGISSALHYLRPAPPFPIVATEGYGSLPMSQMAFDILKQLEGHEASISGRMGEGWDGHRPGIIVPLAHDEYEEEGELAKETAPTEPARIGHRVRALRAPLLGQVGEIASVPSEPQYLPSGLSVHGAQVAFAEPERPLFQPDVVSGQDVVGPPSPGPHFVPWLNLEHVVEEPTVEADN